MKVLRKIKEEKGSITMTVVASMLFIIGAILIAYFSLSSQSNDQSKKTRQISDSYKVTNAELVQKYREVYDEYVDNLNFDNGLGDINSDNVIDLNDVELITNYLNNGSDLEDSQKILADINKDGEITEDDITLLQEYIGQNDE